MILRFAGSTSPVTTLGRLSEAITLATFKIL